MSAIPDYAHLDDDGKMRWPIFTRRSVREPWHFAQMYVRWCPREDSMVNYEPVLTALSLEHSKVFSVKVIQTTHRPRKRGEHPFTLADLAWGVTLKS